MQKSGLKFELIQSYLQSTGKHIIIISYKDKMLNSVFCNHQEILLNFGCKLGPGVNWLIAYFIVAQKDDKKKHFK